VSTFGDLLREYRVRAGLSQDELAEKARISTAAVGALERGVRRALLLGDVEGAVEPLLAYLREMRGNESFTHGELEYAALALALRGQAIAAARLLGRVRSIEQRAPFERGGARQDAYDLLISLLRQQLSDKAMEKAVDAGALLGPDQAIDEALTALTAMTQKRERTTLR
jgi:transcriptional regulator with XRE-family HTH domain